MLQRRFLVAVALPTMLASCAVAQRAAPSALTHSRRDSLEFAHPALDSSTSLRRDMTRGATYGAISGAILAGVGAVLITRNGDRCCEQPSNHLSFGQSVGIVAAGSAVGAFVGAVLGYSYHFNRDPAK